MTRPFVDYYTQNEISPVDQDISDLARHFDRRASLYKFLGLPPAFVEGRSFLEFGPGSGHNQLFTLSLHPARYVLVEANHVGIARMQSLFGEHGIESSRYEIVKSLVEDYESPDRFDVVACEGTIPFQLDPSGFTQTIAKFCKPGGMLIVTTSSAASCMGETTRRLIASRLVDRSASVPEKLERLRPFFAPHLATLKNMSRPADDWILDNLIHPWIGKTFPIDTAIDALDGEFDIYGQSPHFVMDWRWYKDVWGAGKDVNGRSKSQYLSNVANLLDYRVELPPHSPEVGRRIADLSEEIYSLMILDGQGDAGASSRATELLASLAREVREISPRTAESLGEAAACIAAATPTATALPSFESYFGRGSQYISFLRRS